MIIGIRKMKWKDNGERSTDDGHRVYHSEPADKHNMVLDSWSTAQLPTVS